MWKCKALCAGLLLWAGLTGRLAAQVAVPEMPVAPAPPGLADLVLTTGPVAVAPAPPRTLWNFLGISPAHCKKCRDCLCKSTLGQLLNSMTQPLSVGTGGLVPPLCPPPSIADLKKLGEDPNLSPEEATAAKIQADEAGAAARRAAVRYLGTVDCHRYPEAEKALICALRSDRNECVRREAALALSRGCCCTKDTMAALTLTVTGEETDNNPGEMSERVKAAAAYALQICTCHYQGHIPAPQAPCEPPPEPELPEKVPAARTTGPGQVGVALTAYYTRQVKRESMARLIQDAGRALATTVGTREAPRMPAAGQRGLLGVLETARPARPAEEEIRYEEAALGPPGHPSAPRAALDFRAADRVKPVASPAPARARVPSVLPVAPVAEARPVQPARAPAKATEPHMPVPEIGLLRPAAAFVPSATASPAGRPTLDKTATVSPPVFPVGGVASRAAATNATLAAGTAPAKTTAASAPAATIAPVSGTTPARGATVRPPVFPVGAPLAQPGSITSIRAAAPGAEPVAPPTTALLPPLPVGP